MAGYTIAIDGASRGNPGAAGIGVVVYDEAGQVVREISEYIGQTTNNVAEYSALIRGLEEALKLGVADVEIRTDSELLARQMAGTYRVRAAHLIALNHRAKSLFARLPNAKLICVPRSENAAADALAGRAARLNSNPPESSASAAGRPQDQESLPGLES